MPLCAVDAQDVTENSCTIVCMSDGRLQPTDDKRGDRMRRRIITVLVSGSLLVGGFSVSALASSSAVTTPNDKCHEIGHTGGHFGMHSIPEKVRSEVGFNGQATLLHLSTGCPTA